MTIMSKGETVLEF